MARNQKQKKDSLITLTRKYANNHDECVKYFFKMKWPVGFYCEKCGCTHYYSIKRGDVFQCKECGHQHSLLSNTIFQDNKLDLYKLILGMYLFFTTNKGFSAIELANELEINYKTALLLCRKCRILISQSNSEKILDSFFYEADVAYIGSKSKEEHKQGVATEQQPFLGVPGMARIQLEISQPQVFTAKCSEPQVVNSDVEDGGSGVAILSSVRTET